MLTLMMPISHVLSVSERVPGCGQIPILGSRHVEEEERREAILLI